MLEIRLLPARQGDAVWVLWGEGALTRQLIVDMGTEGVGETLRARLSALSERRRRFDLLVVTHVDRDHIGGVLTCLAEGSPIEGLTFDDVWFNGWKHLQGAMAAAPPTTLPLEAMGPAQGERLTTWLSRQAWNRAFRGGRICRESDGATVVLPEGLEITILGPPAERLTELKPVWREEVETAFEKGRLDEVSPGILQPQGLEGMGARRKPTRPTLNDAADLDALANTARGQDISETNGSSIALLLRQGEHRVLLAGDAFASDLVDGLRALPESLPIRLAAFKVPHHGSRENVTQDLVEAVDCPLFLISTDGTQFYHPDAAAIACILRFARRRPPMLGFNVRSDYTAWWADPVWQTSFSYSACYGDTQGLVVTLP
jgi:hypothetical protein